MKVLFTLAVLSSIICPKMALIYQDGVDWGDADYQWAIQNENNCAVYPKMPCTLAIIKTPQNYIIRCGPQMGEPTGEKTQ